MIIFAAFVGDTFDSSIGIPSQSTKSSDDTNDDSIVFEKIKFPNTGAATSKRYHIVPYLKVILLKVLLHFCILRDVAFLLVSINLRPF